MQFELIYRQNPGRVTGHIDGWIEGEQSELVRLFREPNGIELETLDSRLKGRAFIPKIDFVSTRCKLVGSGEIAIDGREIAAGDRVHVTIGGQIVWG